MQKEKTLRASWKCIFQQCWSFSTSFLLFSAAASNIRIDKDSLMVLSQNHSDSRNVCSNQAVNAYLVVSNRFLQVQNISTFLTLNIRVVYFYNLVTISLKHETCLLWTGWKKYILTYLIEISIYAFAAWTEHFVG